MEFYTCAQATSLKECISNGNEGSKVEVQAGKNVEMNIFFDGTANSAFNTQSRLDFEENGNKVKEGDTSEYYAKYDKKREDGDPEASYENYFTNVALLYLPNQQPDKVNDVYTFYAEGSGAIKYEDDSVFRGFAQSLGESGVWSRVAFIYGQINQQLKQIKEFETLTFNVFGFSRGSFYARYFIALLKHFPSLKQVTFFESYWYGIVLLYQLYRFFKFINKNKIIIIVNFVGIHDTVVSHGASHSNDVEPFKLDIGKDEVDGFIFHATALNEYRDHFALTTIDKAVSDGIGIEYHFPGAHADIGGSYTREAKEDQMLQSIQDIVTYGEDLMKKGVSSPRDAINYEFYIEKGYYLEDEIDVHKSGSPFYTPILFEVSTDISYYANKTFSTNAYQFMHLEIMKMLIDEYTNLQFKNKNKDYSESLAIIDQRRGDGRMEQMLYDFKEKAKREIKRKVIDEENRGLKDEISLDKLRTLNYTAEDSKAFFHHYLHNSIKPGVMGYTGDPGNKENPQRIIIKG